MSELYRNKGLTSTGNPHHAHARQRPRFKIQKRAVDRGARHIFSTHHPRGTKQAGIPSSAEEALLDTLTLDEYLLHRPAATFMLTVEGDSMLNAGILPGDTVLVERGRTAKNGDIVLACVDHAWTLKYFFSDRDGIRLEPANPRYSTIRPAQDFSIDGVVCGVVRKLA